jgi:hypothetical protein
MLEQIEKAVERGKDWLLNNQITEKTETYDMIKWNDDMTHAQWYDSPVPSHLIGAYYANLVHNDPWATNKNEVRRQYYNTWHTAQAAVALLNYLEYKDDESVRTSVLLAWDFIDRHQIKDGKYKGVYVEVPQEELKYPLKEAFSFSHTDPKAYYSFANYDNIETDIFPLELYRLFKEEKYLQAAYNNAVFYLENEPEYVFFEKETHNMAISGMSNDAIYGRLAEFTGEDHFKSVFKKQIQRLNLIGLDLRAGNNIRNMYWDATAALYAIEHFKELFGPAMAKLSFLSENVLAGQKEDGVLWYRFKEPGVPDTENPRHQDGAATYAMIPMWGAMYDITGDKRWMVAIQKAVRYALKHQYDETWGDVFSGAFEYAGQMDYKGHKYESLRDISTIFALRSLIPLLIRKTKWAQDFWSI